MSEPIENQEKEERYFAGLDGFFWWMGVVESRQDPLALGRCQIRFFAHNTDSLVYTPTKALPWAHPAFALNNTTFGTPKENDVVFGFFADGFIFNFANNASGSLISTALFRDPSAWYHILVAVDTTQATSSNRIKIYLNGSQITSFGTASYPSPNANLMVNNNVVHYIGASSYSGINLFHDGYLAEVNFIDGQALTPSSFGQTNTITGVWQPLKYTGTYGTNGFYLPFNLSEVG